MNDIRTQVVHFLHAHAVGPLNGANETLHEAPHKRYLMGTLYPTNASSGELLTEEVDDTTGGSVGEELADDPVTLANSWMPSSIGVSFFIVGTPSLTCCVWGARYEGTRVKKKEAFQREPIAERSNPEVVTLARPKEGLEGHLRSHEEVLGGRARIEALWRHVGDGHLVTVTLRNIQKQADPAVVESSLCLHQVGIECVPVDGTIREYPSVDFLSRDPEEAELRLLHRHARVFGIGHGCAADWTPSENKRTAISVRSELMPSFTVPDVVTGGADDDILRLSKLADTSLGTAELSAELGAFADKYGKWIADLKAVHLDIPPSLHAARDALLARLKETLDRIRRGIEVLTSEPDTLHAFRLANQAMLMQMRHGKEDLAGERRPRDQVQLPVIDYAALNYKWRPFQLAFQLLALPSVVDPADRDRELVDLLWFPTGGGKTEAYLALAALYIFHRRLKNGDAGGGTAVLTRYTLRLLTAQQFQRAAALICACEILRRQQSAVMGQDPISIGLWVGDEVVPNRYEKAAQRFTELFSEEFPSNPFQLEQCPWCGTSIIPERRNDDAENYGVRAGNASFEFYCPTAKCPFHTRLPIAVVDDALYDSPPTFLLATVDKFARLAWEERAGVFFGGSGRLPPGLIIQDEMHLLSGPLGTTIGVYEGAVEALMSYHGARPKIIASTATIRNATDQVLGLFGRKVQLFPPAGLTASDSYFAKTDEKKPGRRYIGLMSQSHTPHTTIVHTAAALLQAPVELGFSGQALDAYWTLVAYHNSIRELGRTVTLARDDVPARAKVIAKDEAKTRKLEEHTVVELTSNVGGGDLPKILERLKQTHEKQDSVSLLATTNMLSVGVDIPRLGLMIMNGQPKTTAEYIQASSRVGRGGAAGLVIALYVSTKPRDRSHYEGFIPYHSALYRHVEPTSVTPFSLPSRERALHAALTILVRHGVGLTANSDASRFRLDDPQVERAIQILEERARAIDPDEAKSTSEHLRALAAEWAELAKETAENNRSLYYQASKPHTGLLRNFGAQGSGWATLHSMRNVDRQCRVLVIGEER
ncbi:hypothetical protein JRI60_36335 [Archangium violaceum]|uniref:helicase-related protein n=1 Tax=Archangium violaceum TaxID=83451 RepID=UPI00194E3B1E|nr:helicase-related protein [Archangium violaceum]QRN94557.1 hypothetical protein JRI60_36335 [Archangium violaceum]